MSSKRKDIFSEFPVTPFPGYLKPMAATLIKEPFDSPEFIYEIKWDGFRAITLIREDEINIYSRKGFLFNKKFPNILNSFKNVKKNLILDGEIVVTDEKGKADFESLRYYSPKSNKNLSYFVFDILYYDQYSLMDIPLIERKKILKKYLPKASSLMYVDFIEERGIEFFKLAEKAKIEGIIAKKKNSLYYPSTRTKNWLKIKTNSPRQSLIKSPREF